MLKPAVAWWERCDHLTLPRELPRTWGFQTRPDLKKIREDKKVKVPAFLCQNKREGYFGHLIRTNVNPNDDVIQH